MELNDFILKEILSCFLLILWGIDSSRNLGWAIPGISKKNIELFDTTVAVLVKPGIRKILSHI